MPRDIDLTFDISTGALTLDRVVGNYVKRSETLTLSVTIVSNGASATIPSGLVGTLKPVNTYGTTLAQWTTFSQVGATNVYTASTTINAAAVTTLLGTTTEQANCVFDFAGAGVVESDTLALILKNNVTRDDDTAPTALLNRNDFLVSNGTGLLVNVAAGYAANGAFVAAQASLAITNATNYIEVTAAGVASVNTTAFTAGSYPLATVVASAGAITSNTDLRAWITPKPSTSTGLTVGTSAITGGTTGRILYDNAGVLGEYAITGTGSVMLNTRPSLSDNVPGARPNELTIGSALVPTRIFSMEPTDETNYTALIISQNARRNDTDSGWIRDVADLPMMRTAFEYNYETEGRRQHEFNMDVAPNGAAGAATFPLRMFQGTYITSGTGVGTGAFDFNVILRAGAGFEAGGGVLFTSTSTFNQAATFAGGIHATKIQLGATAGAAIGIDIVPLNSPTQPIAGRSWMRVGGGSSEYLMINAGLTGGYVDFCQDLGSGVRVCDGTGGHVTYLTPPATGTLRVTTNGSTLGTVDAATFTGNAATATKWTTGRTIALTGDVTYTSGALDGSGNVTGTATLANIPAISGANLTTLNADNISSGTLAAARMANAGVHTGDATGTFPAITLNAAQTGITSVGTLTGGATGAGFTVALSTSTITGTLADARLSANVPLLNAANAFTANQSVTGTLSASATSTTANVKPLLRQTFSNAAATITAGNNYIAQTGTMSTNRVLTLPAANAVQAGSAITVVDESGTAAYNQYIAVTRAGSDTIIGGFSSTAENVISGSPRTFTSDGSSKWFIQGVGAYAEFTGISIINSGVKSLSFSSASYQGNSFRVYCLASSVLSFAAGSDTGVCKLTFGNNDTIANSAIANSGTTLTFGVGGSGASAGTGGAVSFTGTVAVTGATTLTGNLTSNGALISTPQALTGAGAVNVTTLTTAVTTTAPAQALTLANGTNGQIKTIVHQALSGGGTWVLTPTTKTGYTTITSTAVGETCTLQFFTTIGWCILSLRGAIAA